MSTSETQLHQTTVSLGSFDLIYMPYLRHFSSKEVSAWQSVGEDPELRKLVDQQPAIDKHYRSVAEVVWPTSKRQGRFASRMTSALSRVLSEEDVFRERLVRQLGFCVKEVRMSPDNMKAFILWDSYLDRHAAVQQELNKRGGRLRSAVATVLGARNVPQLEFRHDSLSPQQQTLEGIFRELDEEREAEELLRREQEAQGGNVEGGSDPQHNPR